MKAAHEKLTQASHKLAEVLYKANARNLAVHLAVQRRRQTARQAASRRRTKA